MGAGSSWASGFYSPPPAPPQLIALDSSSQHVGRIFHLYPRRTVPEIHLRFLIEQVFDTVIAFLKGEKRKKKKNLSFDVKDGVEPILLIKKHLRS